MAGLLWMSLFLGLWIATPFLGEGVVVFREFPGRVLISLPYTYSTFAGASALLFIGFVVARRCGKAGRFSKINAWLKWLALLPILGLLSLPQYPQLSTFLHIFISSGILSAAAVRAFCAETCGEKDRRGLDWMILFAIGTILFCLLGAWITKTVGEHSGDEGHYLIQAKSLHDDGDLDLRNNLGDVAAQNFTERTHVSPNSRNGKWYSFHSSVLCVLLAPTCGHGLYARHLVLGIIAGLGLAGAYLLARLLGASRRGGWAVAILMGGSTFWGIYSCRALPEVLGGTLAVYGFVAIVLQRMHPVRALLLAVPCIGVLPWAYVRFFPLAMTLAGAYVIQCLYLSIPLRRKLSRLSMFAALILGAWTLLTLNQCRMYVGGTVVPVSDFLMASPSGLWHVLTSSKGILVAFPIFACALLGTLGLLQHSRHRAHAFLAFLCFMSIWLTSCSAADWWGGSTVPGRFLVVTVPILMGVLALVLDVAAPGFRLVTFYLGFFSINLFIFLLSVFPDLRALQDPIVVGDFHYLLSTLPRFLLPPGETFPWIVAGGTALLTFLWLFPKIPVVQQYAVVGLTAAVIFLNRTPSGEVSYFPLWTAQKWERTIPNHAFMWAFGDTSRPLSLLDYSNLCSADRWPRSAREVTGRSAKQVNSGGVISYPLIAPNGWDNHPEYRWATLVDPMPVGNHDYALRFRAEIHGDSDIELAIREGGRTHVMKTFKAGTRINEEFAFSIEKRNRLYILMRFVEPAEHNRLIIDKLSITPYQASLTKTGNLAVDDR